MVAQTTLSGSVLVLGDDEKDGQNYSSALISNPVQKSDHGHGNGNESNDDSDNKSLTDTFCGSTMSSSPPVLFGSMPSDRVRSRFLSRLGFSPPRECNFHFTTRNVTPPRICFEDSFQTPLSDHKQEKHPFPSSDASSFPQPSPLPFIKNAQKAKREKGMKSVRFDHAVTVHPIPSHRGYSSRIRDTIWISLADMEKSVPRNCLEFAAENWDWREVLEEKDMFYHKGELIHPVHYFSR
eukprot:scaffold4059_cov177-Amphora_coffeaeformis.AAC.7